MKNIYVLLLAMAASAYSQTSPSIIQTGGPICGPGMCTTFEVEYAPANATDTYTVSPIPYAPEYPFTGGTVLAVDMDDVWSPQFDLPFSFSFYGQGYSSIKVGSNGLITFDMSQVSLLSGACEWNFSETIPSETFPVKNAIYGVYQDMDKPLEGSSGNVNFYVAGNAPFRVFVVNFNALPLFNCENDQLQTSQIVLHETTNEIEIFVQNRTSCTTWTNPNGLIGIQNQDGTAAIAAPGRNTGTWEASNEAWKFAPSGPPQVTVDWGVEGTTVTGTGNSFEFCPESEEQNTVIATVIYSSPSGETTTYSTTLSIDSGNLNLAPAQDLHACSQTGTAVFDLTQNNIIVVNGQPLQHYDINYFLTQTDAENYANPIVDPTLFFSASAMVFYRVEYLLGSCVETGSFLVIVDALPGPPVGATAQDFTAGQTLADLDVSGVAIQWFADADATLPLPETTLLEDGQTYYALETFVPPGCIQDNGRSALDLDNILAVTVHLSLGTAEFENGVMKIYPNPTNGLVTVAANAVIDTIVLYSIQGRLLLEAKPNSELALLDLTGFASGTYVLKVFGQDGIKVAKSRKALMKTAARAKDASG